jgi:hypothetical protein
VLGFLEELHEKILNHALPVDTIKLSLFGGGGGCGGRGNAIPPLRRCPTMTATIRAGRRREEGVERGVPGVHFSGRH